jgi:hypothetical protein
VESAVLISPEGCWALSLSWVREEASCKGKGVLRSRCYFYTGHGPAWLGSSQKYELKGAFAVSQPGTLL